VTAVRLSLGSTRLSGRAAGRQAGAGRRAELPVTARVPVCRRAEPRPHAGRPPAEMAAAPCGCGSAGTLIDTAARREVPRYTSADMFQILQRKPNSRDATAAQKRDWTQINADKGRFNQVLICGNLRSSASHFFSASLRRCG